MPGIIYWVGVVVITVLVYVVYLVLVARSQVKDAPRVDMMVCQKHGAIPEKYTMKIDALVTEKPIEVCPFCWEEKMKAAKHG